MVLIVTVIWVFLMTLIITASGNDAAVSVTE